MALEKVKPIGGQGGKKGHSNMAHRTDTETIKKASKKIRRIEGKKEVITAYKNPTKSKEIG